MTEQGPTLVQYIFLDVVRFTQGRSIEAQVHIVHQLNRLVSDALAKYNIEQHGRILLPTGDGMAIAILKAEPFDLALKIAQSIIEDLSAYNQEMPDAKRRFEVRIGVNQNIDNIITDINGNFNVAGRGINMAQRIMSNVDGGQIAIGEPVFDILCEREAYENAFRPLPGQDKHGSRFRVYQVVREGINGLNTELPSRFQTRESPVPKVTQYAAHFIANAFLMREFLLPDRGKATFTYNSTILLHLMTLDSLNDIARGPFQEKDTRVDYDSNELPTPTYKKIETSEFWTKSQLAELIGEKLSNVTSFFEEGNYEILWAFPTQEGAMRIQQEFPEVWKFVVHKSDVASDGTKNNS